jgi:alpha-amylase/alpha-mannosidase (GH57 family)
VNRYICIHGHFYQPPRENPWLEAIEFQDTAYPYHDWDEKITAECYAPNAMSRILDNDGKIARMVNNYTKISFNFGPTLLAWMEKKAPEVYEAIVEADRQSRKLFAGHGSALAQAYNHLIMPLANSRDKLTQVIWGIRDFEYRFGRKPEGMWLPETAVSTETLEILAGHGITFTILAAHQARQVREIGDKHWIDVGGGKIDPTKPYACRLPSGKTITLFFYDGPISLDIAFGDLLKSGERFAARLLNTLAEQKDIPQLVHVATDGETYGHHHRFGDMALAYALSAIDAQDRALLSNYGAYLEQYPPRDEVEIFENTSWSCAHGVERWRSDCGCNTGSHPEWHQTWRAPLREALDWLRDTMAPRYEEKGRLFFTDPWAARNAYIDIILDRSPESLRSFFSAHAAKALSDDDKTVALKLLELQRHTLLMYTSCGWFFDDLSDIETVQILQYAGRAVQLSQEIFGDGTEPQFMALLEQARSNIPAYKNGRHIYDRLVKPAMADLKDVAAHYMISSLFTEYPEQTSIYCYTIDRKDYQGSEAGRAKLAVGRARVTSEITQESADLCFGVLHWGDQSLNCGVKGYQGEEAYRAMSHEIADAFNSGDFPHTMRLMDKHFGSSPYSMKSLFRDEQRQILNLIMKSAVHEAENEYRQLYEYHAPMMRFLKELRIAAPKALYTAAEVTINAGLRRAFEETEFDPEQIEPLLREAAEIGVALDADTLELACRKAIERLLAKLADNPSDLPLMGRAEAAIALLDSLPFQVNLWKAQNILYEMLQGAYGEFRRKAEQGNKKPVAWLKRFRGLGNKLSVRVG